MGDLIVDKRTSFHCLDRIERMRLVGSATVDIWWNVSVWQRYKLACME